MSDRLKLDVYDIWVPRTPQRGSWCAGVTVRDVASGAEVSWSGGAEQYEGDAARLRRGTESMNLTFDDVRPGREFEVFLAIDDDPAKAGTERAADKITFRFSAVRKDGGTCYWHEAGNWKVGVDYAFHD